MSGLHPQYAPVLDALAWVVAVPRGGGGDRARALVAGAGVAQCAAEAARAYADPEATGYWRAALRGWEALSRPYEAAYAGLRLCEALAASGSAARTVARGLTSG
jgi:hypothetical protein